MVAYQKTQDSVPEGSLRPRRKEQEHAAAAHKGEPHSGARVGEDKQLGNSRPAAASPPPRHLLPSQIGAGEMARDTTLARAVTASALVLALCVRALPGSALPAVSSYEFTAYRMQQYNLAQQKHGKSGRHSLMTFLHLSFASGRRRFSFVESVFGACSGCRGAIVVAEARSADEPLLTRRCVIMKVPDFTTEKYLQAQRQQAAAVLILLPQNVSGLPADTIKVASPPTRPAGVT